MTEFIYGILGAVGVLALLVIGAIVGWKGNNFYRVRTAQAVQSELTEQEKRRAKEEKTAMEQLLNYNADIAYGLATYDDISGERSDRR